MFFILRENVFDSLHQFPLSVKAEFAHIRNFIFGLQQVLEINICLIHSQFVGDDLLFLADLRMIFVAQQMDGEADRRGAVFKLGGVGRINGIRGRYGRGREICIVDGAGLGKVGFILWRGAGDHVPGTLVVSQLIAIAPGEVDDAFSRQVVNNRKIGADRFGVVFTAASFDTSLFQLNIERQGGACFAFRSEPNHCILLTGFLSGLNHVEKFHVRSSFLDVRSPGQR